LQNLFQIIHLHERGRLNMPATQPLRPRREPKDELSV
jgi:hypothetical protein